ncbi:glycosyltransferase [Microbacterium sp. LEMMJ01]|uniref:glycosyltransferase n=1 Tax=Microbacterium sp. LEMMJ01 TaxID=1978350 RepID=UPI000A1FE2BF|nr:glycosyltransferase [Microbacterium sp. LEMMJ01]OSP09236.1 hypothetical protein B7W94_01110 [Microbacterium sp. LEMMJ01]
MTGDRRSIVFGVTIDYQLRYHEGLYQRLADDGWDVHLVSGAGPIGEALAQYPGVTAYVLPMARTPHPIADLRALSRWWWLLKRLRPTVVVIGTPKAGLLGGIAAAMRHVPVRLYELHGLRLESAQGPLRMLLRMMERVSGAAATQVVAVGPSLRERALAERLVPAEKIVVLGAGSPNGVDVRQFGDARHDATARTTMREHLGIPAPAQIVVFMGRLTADKGLVALAEAMAIVQQHSHAWLVIVGGIDDASGAEGERLLREAVARLVVVGEVADVKPYLAAADVLCLPSRREGMPTVVLEAFAASVPVVATRATGIVDLVTDGITGWLVPVDDAAALARALRQALDDRDTARRMADAAAALVSERFDREIVQTAWFNTVRDALMDSGR